MYFVAPRLLDCVRPSDYFRLMEAEFELHQHVFSTLAGLEQPNTDTPALFLGHSTATCLLHDLVYREATEQEAACLWAKAARAGTSSEIDVSHSSLRSAGPHVLKFLSGHACSTTAASARARMSILALFANAHWEHSAAAMAPWSALRAVLRNRPPTNSEQQSLVDTSLAEGLRLLAQVAIHRGVSLASGTACAATLNGSAMRLRAGVAQAVRVPAGGMHDCAATSLATLLAAVGCLTGEHEHLVRTRSERADVRSIAEHLSTLLDEGLAIAAPGECAPGRSVCVQSGGRHDATRP